MKRNAAQARDIIDILMWLMVVMVATWILGLIRAM
jgi:hypothetical protein